MQFWATKASTKTESIEKGVELSATLRTLLMPSEKKRKMQKNVMLFMWNSAKKTRITNAIIYRPPKLQADDGTGLYDEIRSVIQNKQAIIIGNFNCPSIDWATMNGA